MVHVILCYNISMNFGHLFGAHHFESQWQFIIHYIVSFLPIVLSIILEITVVKRILQNRTQIAKDKIKED